ncbi:MAG: NAD(P)/FAD-dependent oxidoreductase [Gemmatimonadaceae bacterium]
MTEQAGNFASQRAPTRIVVLGAGFGGIQTVRAIEKHCRHETNVEITLVSRENFFVITPLLFEACSGRLELRHCAQPVRPALRVARFIEAEVDSVDVDGRIVHIVTGEDARTELPYDHLVVALGATTNLKLIPGSAEALTFKSVADAFVLRNQLIERFERADATRDLEHRQRLLTIVVIGGGLVGVELVGELTAFADDILRYYPRIERSDLAFHLVEASPQILPEVSRELADASAYELKSRGVVIHVGTPVKGVEAGRVHLADETIEADTIVLAAGIVPGAAIARIPVEHDKRGRIAVDATMRSTSHPAVWALGDCATIPGPEGRPYPALAQHAVREAKQLARNVAAVMNDRKPEPFAFDALGTMVALGHSRAVVQAFGTQFSGFFAWWFRRTYYLFQMPLWDRRLRIVLDWTIELFFRPDITKVDLVVEQRRAEVS